MTTTKDLQKQLTEALVPLKHHAEVSSFLHDLKNEKNDIFTSFLPYEKDISKMTPTEKEQLKYYKAFWIINELIATDPSILDDKKNKELRRVAHFCYSNAPQLHEIYGVPLEPTTEAIKTDSTSPRQTQKNAYKQPRNK